ncbi:MAG: maleylpyruvate isomerase family mycothiol-dependent enzyme [Acidimicrobiia bacterium]
MGVTHDPRDLLGAYALDAVDDDEATAVEALMAADADTAAEVHRLRGVAAWIGATEALEPPGDLRAQMLERATPVPDELRVYRMAVARHEELLDSVPEDALNRPTANGLDVGDLVVHLAAMESAVAETIGLEQSVTDETDVEARTERYVEAIGADPLGTGRAAWRAAAEALDAWAAAGGEQGGVPWLGFTVSRRTLLATRAFEIWTHDDDIRDVLGRDRVVPGAAELGLMSDVAVGILPVCLAAVGERPAAAARVVLTGEGGGEWTVALDGGTYPEPAVTITMDVVDYCRVVAERLPPDDCGATFAGDEALGRKVLACASALATL